MKHDAVKEALHKKLGSLTIVIGGNHPLEGSPQEEASETPAEEKKEEALKAQGLAPEVKDSDPMSPHDPQNASASVASPGDNPLHPDEHKDLEMLKGLASHHSDHMGRKPMGMIEKVGSSAKEKMASIAKNKAMKK